MVKKILMETKNGKYFSKSIKMLSQPGDIASAFSPLAWKILNLINESPLYPTEISKKMGIEKQNIYYYINKLRKAGIIESVKEEKIHGALCKYFAPSSQAFGIELQSKEKEVRLKNEQNTENLRKFLAEFIEDGVFNGKIIVGSPVQHGPYLTAARDSHYAVQLSFLLGNLCNLPNNFVVELDTEIKNKNENFILIGGPVANIITSSINQFLKIKFNWEKLWSIDSDNKKYTEPEIGLITKIKNPWHSQKWIILFAGLGFSGTESAIWGLVDSYEKLLKKYSEKQEFYCIIKGLDKNGDGKIDDIIILE